ncbi:MAG: MauE/DoxX family redox-associated membrane protein [Pseudohongiella sp.]|nr:MauE/DoxX family redox-associated membrane protein [Pseudohongiella sp.]MDO9519453.1 MauE/DoxX family redox-associated membrane protein [Pseudohongiella sp.]MDP2127539.1 MauE/DoxX family redox-associated membrane protein [Pseudohongiella sp.]
MIDPLLPLVISTALALLFFMAARHKLSDNRRFQAQLAAYQIVPESLLALSAKALPWLEMSLVFALLIPVTRPIAALVAATLLVVYALAMAVNMSRGRSEIDCGCGDIPQTLSPMLLLRNAVLATGALVLVVPVLDRAITTIDLIFVALFTAVLATAYLMVELLVRNHSVLKNFGLRK